MPPCTSYRTLTHVRKFISIIVVTVFVITSIKIPSYAQMAEGEVLHLPNPGVMVNLSPEFIPAQLQGITIHPDNALQFDFLIHRGDQYLEGDQKKEEYRKLIKYFLASLTIPDEDQWVNLSPYEKDRIIKDDFGKTEMGRDLLAEDYMLKQITSSLIYPEDGLGKKFWDKIYERAWSEYHTSNIPVNTFNKVWIIPDQAIVYESGNTAYILKSHLKVMLEEDYLSLKNHLGITSSLAASKAKQSTHAIGSQVIREIILPELEREVNEGKNFATLRQMYGGMILATWYKKALRESLLGQVYADKAKVKGVDQDPKTNQEIYKRYLKAFKKGVFNYIKEDVDKYTNEAIPRKYFSGGFNRTILTTDDKGITHIVPNVQVVHDLGILSRTAISSLAFELPQQEANDEEVDVDLQGTNENNAAMTARINDDEPHAIEFSNQNIAVTVNNENYKIYVENAAWYLTAPFLIGTVLRNIKFGPLVQGTEYGQMPGRNYAPNGFTFRVTSTGNKSKVEIKRIKGNGNQIVLTGDNLVEQKQVIAHAVPVNPDGRITVPMRVASSRVQLPVVSPPRVSPVSSSRPREVSHHYVSIDTYNKPNRTNQDFGFVDPDKNVIVVADGMGGHVGGAVASRQAIARIKLLIGKIRKTDSKLTMEESLKDIVRLVQQGLVALQSEDPNVEGMGTTLSFAIIWKDSQGAQYVSGVNIGDSRIYLRNRSGQMVQLSKDDSWVQNQIDMGYMTEQQGELSPRKNEINDSLGDPTRGYEFSSHQVFTYRVHDGDIVVAMSDGVSDNLGKVRIEGIARAHAEPVALSNALITKARSIALLWGTPNQDKLSKPDDITIAALRVDSAMKAFIKPVEQVGNTPLGGIDFNAAHLNLQIRRDGHGVPLPLGQQDMAQLSHIQGFEPEIIEIKPAINVPIISELEQKLRSSSAMASVS